MAYFAILGFLIFHENFQKFLVFSFDFGHPKPLRWVGRERSLGQIPKNVFQGFSLILNYHFDLF